MKTSVAKKYIMRLLALFTVIRGYNVFFLVLAMYLTSYFIFSKESSLSTFFKNWEITYIVLASAFTVSAGFIINNFYDLDRDRIGRPIFHYVSKLVNQNFKLSIYLLFNCIALIFAYLGSWRVALFFLFYQFMVWFYSHKLNKIIFINNLFTTLLYLMPFFALFLFYNNYSPIIFIHGLFLGSILLTLDIAKDFVTYKADIIYGYQTLPTVLGFKKSKIILSTFLGITILIGFWISNFEEVGHMSLYFHFLEIVFLLLICLLWQSKENWQYHLLHLIIKLMLGVGVLSIAWIKINPLDLHKLI